MPTTLLAGQEVQVDDEGFMTEYDQWTEDVATELATNIGLGALSEDHWRVIKFLREDYAQEGTTATLRRVTKTGGIPTKELFVLFPKKPAKKMAYVAGLPKPVGCI